VPDIWRALCVRCGKSLHSPSKFSAIVENPRPRFVLRGKFRFAVSHSVMGQGERGPFGGREIIPFLKISQVIELLGQQHSLQPPCISRNW
jgi:hypothetical protein